MFKEILSRALPDIGQPPWQVCLRIFWIVVQVFAAFALGDQISPFFYQQF